MKIQKFAVLLILPFLLISLVVHAGEEQSLGIISGSEKYDLNLNMVNSARISFGKELVFKYGTVTHGDPKANLPNAFFYDFTCSAFSNTYELEDAYFSFTTELGWGVFSASEIYKKGYFNDGDVSVSDDDSNPVGIYVRRILEPTKYKSIVSCKSIVLILAYDSPSIDTIGGTQEFFHNKKILCPRVAVSKEIYDKKENTKYRIIALGYIEANYEETQADYYLKLYKLYPTDGGIPCYTTLKLNNNCTPPFVNTKKLSSLAEISLDIDPEYGLVVTVFTGTPIGGSSCIQNIYYLVINPNGNPVSCQFKDGKIVGNEKTANKIQPAFLLNPSVACMGLRQFLVAWNGFYTFQDDSGKEFSGGYIVGSFFDLNMNAVIEEGEILLNNPTPVLKTNADNKKYWGDKYFSCRPVLDGDPKTKQAVLSWSRTDNYKDISIMAKVIKVGTENLFVSNEIQLNSATKGSPRLQDVSAKGGTAAVIWTQTTNGEDIISDAYMKTFSYPTE